MRELLAYFRGIDPELRAVLVPAVRIAAILGAAWLLNIAAGRLIRASRLYVSRRTGADEIGRIETLARVFRNTAFVVIVLVAGMLVLGELGISIAPILATAGVAGIAIGFGAQSLVRDYFTGFFLLLDDQVRQGDVIEIGGVGGLVEEVTLRYVRLRDFSGHVHYVPNSEIKIVTNRTRDFAHAVIEIGVGYRVDPEAALAVMREVAAEMRAEPHWAERIANDAEIIGVERWADSAVILRCRLRVVPPIEQWSVRREFLKRLKKAYDARGIEIPFPQLTLHAPDLARKSDSSA